MARPFLLENRLSRKFVAGNAFLTQRIRRVSNLVSYYEIIRRCFCNKDLLQRARVAEIMRVETCCAIRVMNSHNPLFTGFFIEQLILKSIQGIKHTAHVSLTETIINQALRYASRKDYHDKTCVINLVAELDANFYRDIEHVARQLCRKIKGRDKIDSCILINHKLRGNYNFSIASECDLLINNTLYDIKCTRGELVNNRIYELLQLLGYSALFRINPKYRKIISEVVVINLLQGETRTYSVSDLTEANYKEYLAILNAHYATHYAMDKRTRFAGCARGLYRGFAACFRGVICVCKCIFRKK